MSAREVGEQLCCSEKLVRAWEEGSPLPNEGTYRKLLDALDLDKESLPPAHIRPSPVVLGGHIRRRREALAMTQGELALHLGVTPGAIFRWESGKALPKQSNRERVSRFLGQSIYTLYESFSSTPPMASALRLGTLGDLMRGKREELGMNQLELGRLLGVTKATISAWENGRERPRISYHVRLSEFLGMELEELTGLVRQL